MSETGMRAIDKVRAGYRAQTRSVVIAEWDGLELFFGPLTTADLEAVEAREPKTQGERNLLLLIHKAKDKAGAPLFTYGDLHYLRTEAEVSALTLAFEAMYGQPVTVERAETEYAENPTSDSGSA